MAVKNPIERTDVTTHLLLLAVLFARPAGRFILY